MDRTAVTFHALLFKLKMVIDISRQEIDKNNRELQVLPARIGDVQQFLQMIDVGQQQPMLHINLFGASCKLIVPENHTLNCFRHDLIPATAFDPNALSTASNNSLKE